jgi:hypothetical protein
MRRVILGNVAVNGFAFAFAFALKDDEDDEKACRVQANACAMG